MNHIVSILILMLLSSSSGHASGEGFEPAGAKIMVTLEELPAAYEEQSHSNPSSAISPPADWLPQVPAGFKVNVFAKGLYAPREMAMDDNGNLYVTSPYDDSITIITDYNVDGIADEIKTCRDDFDFPYGIAFHKQELYVSDSNAIWNLGDNPCDESTIPHAVTATGAMGRARGHRSRNLAIHPDGQGFFVAIGSMGNIAIEPSPHATIQQFSMTGESMGTFASGLRNPVGIAFHPEDHSLWTVVNERDGLGDKLVPDYLTQVEQGDFYGWPYAYLGGIPQPDYASLAPDKVKKTLMPDVLFRAHSAPLGLTFYEGDMFPPNYKGDAFVALHGSWNAGEAQGYIVARIDWRNGVPAPDYEVFMTNFRQDNGNKTRPRVTGRPAGILTYRDGSLLVSDDEGGVIWRIAH